MHIERQQMILRKEDYFNNIFDLTELKKDPKQSEIAIKK